MFNVTISHKLTFQKYLRPFLAVIILLPVILNTDLFIICYLRSIYLKYVYKSILKPPRRVSKTVLDKLCIFGFFGGLRNKFANFLALNHLKNFTEPFPNWACSPIHGIPCNNFGPLPGPCCCDVNCRLLFKPPPFWALYCLLHISTPSLLGTTLNCTA